MPRPTLQSLRERFSLGGHPKSEEKEQASRFFNDSELTCLKSQLREANPKARDAVRNVGARRHPKIVEALK